MTHVPEVKKKIVRWRPLYTAAGLVEAVPVGVAYILGTHNTSYLLSGLLVFFMVLLSGFVAAIIRRLSDQHNGGPF